MAMSRLRAVNAAAAATRPDDEMVQLVVDTLVQRFVNYADRLEAPVVHDVATSVAMRRCGMDEAVRSIAEIIGVPVPDEGRARTAAMPSTSSGSPMAPKRRPQRTGAEVALESRALDEMLGGNHAFEATVRERLSLLRQLRRSWQEDITRSLAVATRALQQGGVATVADFLGLLGRFPRMKERLELRHVAPVIELVTATLSCLSGAGACSAQIKFCLMAGQALHDRFRPRITGICNGGGSVDSIEFSRVALEHFDCLAAQLSHFARRSDEAGDLARKLNAEISGANEGTLRRR